MRALFLYPFCNFGGVATVFRQRHEILKSRGIEPSYIFDRDNGGFAAFQAQVSTDSFLGYDKVPEMVGSEYSRPDVAIAFDDPVMLRKVLDLGAPRAVIEVHSSLERSLQRLMPSDMRRAHKIVVPSQWSARTLETRFGSSLRHKLCVVPNTVGDAFRSSFAAANSSFAPGRRPVIWVGKIIPDKNYHDAIRIMGAVNKLAEGLEFIFVSGGIAIRKEIEEFLGLLSAYGIDNATRWLTNLSSEEIAGLHADAAAAGGAFLSTSKHESFGIAILEAMYMGLPVTVGNVDALTELFEPEGPELFDLSDFAAAVERLTRLLTDREFHRRESDRARARARTITGQGAVERYVDEVFAAL